MQNLFVITGGPGAGKTALLNELQKLGFPCVPEVARQIIQEQLSLGGKALPWEDRRGYTDLMLQRSIDSYRQHSSSNVPTFFDRGIPDTLCYAHLIRLEEIAPIRLACDQFRYSPQVFIAPPWQEIYKPDTERRQDFTEAIRTYKLMWKTYAECGYELIELPKSAPAERARFVIQAAGLAIS